MFAATLSPGWGGTGAFFLCDFFGCWCEYCMDGALPPPRSKSCPDMNAMVMGSSAPPAAGVSASTANSSSKPASFRSFISCVNGLSSLSRAPMLNWIISMAMCASLTFSVDSWMMSAWFFSISCLALFVASMSSALACRDDALGIARHASTRSFVSFFRVTRRSSMSLIVCTTRWSSTGREEETAKKRGARGVSDRVCWANLDFGF
mmetsp:Transcript_10144/g.39632  ORF Transcript_10144/g.39632 Transcript_10144/m.39632 type:complete len:206 (-) Transcript_10144:51-668(-)